MTGALHLALPGLPAARAKQAIAECDDLAALNLVVTRSAENRPSILWAVQERIRALHDERAAGLRMRRRVAVPPGPGRYVLHYPDDGHRTSPPREVVVEDRGDGVLVWRDPYTGTMFGTGDTMPALSDRHRFDPIDGGTP